MEQLTTRPLRKDAARNRAAILVAAGGAFAELGIDVCVDEIARRAGVGMGTLYRHFPTKGALVDAILEERFAAVTAFAEDALELPDPWDGVVHYLNSVVELQTLDRGFKDLIAARLREEDALVPARAGLESLVARIVERAQAAGALRADVTVADMSVLLWATGRVVECSEPVSPGQWRRFLALALDGLRPVSATPLPEPPLDRRQYRAAISKLAEPRR